MFFSLRKNKSEHLHDIRPTQPIIMTKYTWSKYKPISTYTTVKMLLTNNRERTCFSADMLWRAHVKVTAPPSCFLAASGPVEHEVMLN